MLKRPKLPQGLSGKVHKDRVREGDCGVCDQLVDILLIGWWWGNRKSASSTFWFQLVWGLRAYGQHTVNFFHLEGFQYLQNGSKDMVYSPWGRTKGPWLCLMVKVLLFCLAWLFFFLSAFSHFLIKFILWLKVFYRQKASGGHGWGSILGRPHMVLLGYKMGYPSGGVEGSLGCYASSISQTLLVS